MINLAKTPANVDFQSKYYKQPLTDRTARPLDTPPAPPSLPVSPVEGSSQNDLINQRPAAVRHSLVRNSKSEDQLAYDELTAHESDEDKLNSSCHTLLDSSYTPNMPPTTTLHHNTRTAPPFVSSESSSSRSADSSISKGSSSGDQLLSSQPSEEATCPDFSTSSLISCSEH